MVVVLVVSGVVMVVLRVRTQDYLALQQDLGVGHHWQRFGLHGLVDSGGVSGAGIDGDHG